MDQVKLILKQLVKQRFWIAIGVAMLVPLIAYFTMSGSIKGATTAKIGEITAADKGAQEYANGDKPTRVHADIVNEDQERLKGEVTKTWRTLYERQAPLLTWPKAVEADIPNWGQRVWPKGVDASRVQQTITNYVETYNTYVEQVYQSFKPFNPMDGTGIVAAPPKETLLLAPVFDPRDPPKLKAIWDTQERLWLQRAVLDVVADVNKTAKDWNSAIIKQITQLEVATATSQDQPTATKETTLKETEEITVDGAPPPEEESSGSGMMGGGGMMGGAGMMGGGPGGMARMGINMSGMGGGGGPAAKAGADISYTEGAGGRYRLFPITLGVLIEQEHTQDLLAALKNSPMMIQIKEVQWSRPDSPVIKPVKDETGGMYNQYAGQMGMPMNMMGGGRGRMTFAGPGMMGMNMGMGSRGPGAMNPMMGMGTMMGRMPGMGGSGGAVAPPKQGTDVRQRFLTKQQEEAAKKDKDKNKDKADAEPIPKAEPYNPYIDIVQFTVYGQARFYNNPDATPVESSGGAPAPAATPKAAAPPRLAD